MKERETGLAVATLEEAVFLLLLLETTGSPISLNWNVMNEKYKVSKKAARPRIDSQQELLNKVQTLY